MQLVLYHEKPNLFTYIKPKGVSYLAPRFDGIPPLVLDDVANICI